MAQDKCPGQDTQFWDKDDIFNLSCPDCGVLIEFFKDDVRRYCPNCKKEIFNPQVESGCVLWCPKAAECIGPERYKDIMETKERLLKRKEDLDGLFAMVEDKDNDVRTLFKRLYFENKDVTKIFDTRRLNEIRNTNPDLFKRAIEYFSRFNKTNTL